MMVKQAAVYLKVGLALDLWADKLIQSAENGKLIVVDCSRGVQVLGAESHEGPHPLGNPHYWLSPANWEIIAENVRLALSAADPAHAAVYESRRATFATRTDSAETHWREVLAPCTGWAIVSSHSSWDYFAAEFGLEIAGVVSRIPDAEPSPSDLATLEKTIRHRGKVVFLREPFTSDRFPKVLERDTDLPVLIVPSSVGAMPQAQDLWSQFDYLTTQLSLLCQKSR
jgi:ABC-type Zn uptake system ZnuABC Zn-binding protein ZnuA